MRRLFLTLIVLGQLSPVFSKEYTLKSPDGTIEVRVDVAATTTYSVSYMGTPIITASPLSMKFSNGVVAGVQMKVKNSAVHNVNTMLTPVIKVKNAQIANQYQELVLTADRYKISFRAFNDGMAYRFETMFKEEVQVIADEVCYHFNKDYSTYFPKEESMFTHQERKYLNLKLSETIGQFCSPPMMVNVGDKIRVLMSEADLEDYAGLYLQGVEGHSMKGIFPHYPLETKPMLQANGQESDRSVPVTKAADFIAQTKGTRTYPWRYMIITDDDRKLIESEMVFKLASPNRVANTSWIKPGKVAWDWYNYLNITGVDFRAGVNTDTYKYFIDFASKWKLEYVILDEGWYDLNDITKVVPEVDMEALIAYSKQKNVGLILWTTWLALEKKVDEAFAMFDKWGVKGLKIDFMQRDDQWMVNYYYRIAKKAAEHQMLVDYHGAYKPTGLTLTYPNMLTSEGVMGAENNKWSEDITPDHNVTIPFIRMVAGPMDYTPGGMDNASAQDYKIRFNRPMTLGTRCHQLGMYVVFESPLQMLCDNPTSLDREKECMEFLCAAPTVWDETKVLSAKISEYVIIARRNGDTWYLGGMTGWTPREITVSLDFLGEGNYQMTSWEDGVNVDRNATDFAVRKKSVNKNNTLTVKMASGGGFAAILSK